MWLIVMCAFGNFYYTINNNTEQTDDNHRVGNYTYIKFIDAMLQMYMFSLGELDLDAQRSATDRLVGFALFILSTFVLSVIFLNIIIAIISDSYSKI